MALIFADRVKETTATTGTGTITLAGAVVGFQSFNTPMASADTCYYCIVDGIDWEVGLGTFTDTVGVYTLARTPYASTNANNPINLAGGSDVFMTLPAIQCGVNTQYTDTVTGTKYKLQITSGEIVKVEV